MSDPIIEEYISSVGDYISHLQSSQSDKRRLFRGQNTDKPLLSRIVRLAIRKEMSLTEMKKIEQKMLERFRRESVPMHEATQELSDLELLSIAQHHTMPTRLLDWTANALAGLWFAVSSYPPDDEDHGVVWMLDNPNEKQFHFDDDIFELDKTYFFQPSHIDRRIPAQSAWLCIQRCAPRSNSEKWCIPLEKQIRYRSKLTKFIIPKDFFDSIQQELRLLGVRHVFLFPDLTGLCEDIEAELA